MNHRAGRYSTPPRASEPFDGLLLVDKPSGFTSHDVVAKIRGHFKFKKVGHGGTLDPAATGLLVILLGRGTKLSSVVMGGDKVYEGTIHLGITTDSQDGDGQVINERDASGVTQEMLQNEMQSLVGDLMQTPPMVSAVKQNGVPLYKLARKGKEVERKARLIHVYEFKLLDFESPRGTFRLRSTKGTYVRTACHDVGEALGCGAFLETLRRTRSGTLDVKDALTLDEIIAMTPAQLQERVIPFNTVNTQEV